MMKFKWIVTCLALCTISCSSPQSKFEFLSQQDSVLFSFQGHQVESIKDTSYSIGQGPDSTVTTKAIDLYIDENIASGLSKVRGEFLGGTFLITLADGRSVAVRIRDVFMSDAWLCPSINAERNRLFMPESGGPLKISWFDLPESKYDPECRERVQQMREVFQSIKTEVGNR